MKNTLVFSVLLTVLMFGTAVSQTPKPSPDPQKQGDDVVRTTTNLVQLDVVVTDKDGNAVVDLTPDEFEITEDKSKQSITNFSYISLAPTVTITQPRNGTPVAPAPIRPEEVRRTIALVIDDLGLSFESLASVKTALRKFVNEQMSPTDLVAILRTSRGMGSLQQFTTDRNQLLAAIDGISWFASGRSGLSPNAQIDTQLGEEFTQGAQIINEVEEARAAQYSVGTIQTLSRILRGLEDLPGRKSVMMFAESFKMFSSQGRNIQLIEALEKLADQANRTSTVIYTIDAGGLNPQELSASDRVAGSGYSFDPAIAWGTSGVARTRNRTSNQTIDAPNSLSAQAATDSAAAFRRLDALVEDKKNQANETKTVLGFLAEETGGIFTQNSNDLSTGTQKMLREQQGYYLIGYRPSDTSVDPETGVRKDHNIAVKVKRSGVRVRNRAGYYGIAERAKSSKPLTRDQQLAKALTSPFTAGGIGLRITPLWANDATAGSQLKVLLHLSAKDLTFSAQPDGSQVAVVDFLAVSYGNEGRVIDQYMDTQTINISKDAYQQMVDDGLIFILHVAAKKPGPVQVRVAVRDANTERIGSANQFLEIPDLGKNNLTLSGIYLSGSTPAQPGDPATNTEQKAETKSVTAGPGVRRLRHGMVLSYSYSIYNAALDDTKKPQLQTQLRLFRDAKEVFTGKPLAFNPGQQTNMKSLDGGGRLLVGTALTPGQYVLQVTVTDALAKNKRYGTTSQWIDFEIVK